MNKGMVLFAVAVVLVVLGYVLSDPGDKTRQIGETRPLKTDQTGSETDIQHSQQAGALSSQETSSEFNRREIMQQTFTGLQQLRKKLQARANFLKSKIWGLELPPDEAREVSHKMRQAYAYLKNPPMLGAYYEPGEIKAEMKRVEAMLSELQTIEELLDNRATEARR